MVPPVATASKPKNASSVHCAFVHSTFFDTSPRFPQSHAPMEQHTAIKSSAAPMHNWEKPTNTLSIGAAMPVALSDPDEVIGCA